MCLPYKQPFNLRHGVLPFSVRSGAKLACPVAQGVRSPKDILYSICCGCVAAVLRLLSLPILQTLGFGASEVNDELGLVSLVHPQHG